MKKYICPSCHKYKIPQECTDATFMKDMITSAEFKIVIYKCTACGFELLIPTRV